jgi:hypothetical protein
LGFLISGFLLLTLFVAVTAPAAALFFVIEGFLVCVSAWLFAIHWWTLEIIQNTPWINWIRKLL